MRKGMLESSKHACRQLTKVLSAADVDKDSYADLLYRDCDEAMLRSFSSTPLQKWIYMALAPTHPRYIVHEPKAVDVKHADAELQQLWGLDTQGEQFRVAAILDCGKVRQNLIYFYQEGW